MTNERTNTSKQRFLSNSRRRLIKAAGVGLSAGLAGCSEGGGGNDTEATTSTGGGGSVTTSSSDSSLEGVTIDFWEIINVQSRSAKESVLNNIKQFEQQTGAKVNHNPTSAGAIAGAKWINSFKNGEYPVVYNGAGFNDGKFITSGFIEPLSTYEDMLPSDLMKNLEWIMPIIKSKQAGFKGDEIFELPIGFLPRNPFVVRRDHLKQAGLDPENDFPPKDYQHLKEVATTLQKDGPGSFGFQVLGAQYDWNDTVWPMNMPMGGIDGNYLTEDWTDTNFDNDVWLTTMQRMQELYLDLGVSNPNTPTMSDEDTAQLMINGQISMSNPEWYNFPTFVDRAESMVKSGKIMWGPAWAGDSGQRASIGYQTMGITRRPKSVDKSKWKKQQEAGVELMKLFFSKEFQRKLPSLMGIMPVRQDVWEDVEKNTLGASKNLMPQTAFEMAKSAKTGLEYYPQLSSIPFEIATPHVQKMLRGDVSPEKAMKQSAKETRNFLQSNPKPPYTIPDRPQY